MNEWKMDYRKEEAKAETSVMCKNSSETGGLTWSLSWSRVVTVEMVTRRQLKGRDHRMCRAWVADLKSTGEWRNHSQFGGLNVHGDATFEMRNQELCLVLISLPIRYPSGDARQMVGPWIWSSWDRKHHLTGMFIVKGLNRSLQANVYMEERARDKVLNYFNSCWWSKGGGPCKMENKKQEYVGFQ